MESTATRSGQHLSDLCFVMSLSNALSTSYFSRNPTSVLGVSVVDVLVLHQEPDWEVEDGVDSDGVRPTPQ
jgi:hypothetical protein